MKNFLLALAVILTLSTCKKDPDPFTLNPCGLSATTTLKYAAIGDEFSSGIYLSEGEAWPFLVRDYLNSHGYPDTELTLLGENDIKAEELGTYLEENNGLACKTVATVMVGVHDQLTGATSEQFRTHLTTLLNMVVAGIGSPERVTCVCLPDYSDAPGLPASAGSPSLVKSKIEAFNQVILEVCTEFGVGHADIYPISEPSYQLMVTPEDEFHADDDQHALWSNVVTDIVYNGLD